MWRLYSNDRNCRRYWARNVGVFLVLCLFNSIGRLAALSANVLRSDSALINQAEQQHQQHVSVSIHIIFGQTSRSWMMGWFLDLHALCRHYILIHRTFFFLYFFLILANLCHATEQSTTDSNFLFNYVLSFGKCGPHMKPSSWRRDTESSSSRKKLKFQLGSLTNDQSDENTNTANELWQFKNQIISSGATSAQCRRLMVMIWIGCVTKRQL